MENRKNRLLMQNPENFLNSRLSGGGFFHAVMQHRRHSLFDRQVIYLLGGSLAQNRFANRGVHRQNLVQPDPAAETRVSAFLTAFAAVKFLAAQKARRDNAGQTLSLRFSQGQRLPAIRTDFTNQPLTNRQIDCRGDEVRLNPQIEEPRQGGRSAVGVQGRENQMTGQGGIDRDAGRFRVADLPDHDDIRVLPQYRAQSVGKVQSGPRVDLNLLNSADRVLDRVFYRHDRHFLGV